MLLAWPGLTEKRAHGAGCEMSTDMYLTNCVQTFVGALLKAMITEYNTTVIQGMIILCNR